MIQKHNAEPSNPATSDDQLIAPEEAAAFLGCTPMLLAKWRHARVIDLPYIKLGRLVRYRIGDIRAFIQKRRQ